ncbi:MAG: glycosyltransferase family 39 protein [Bryobacteraceae bacterium]
MRLFRPGLGELPDPLRTGELLFRAGLLVCALAAWPAWRAWRRPAAAVEAGPSWTAREGLLLGALLAFALALRLYRLNLGIWYDEIVAVVYYLRIPFGECLTTYANENQQFLFSIFAHLSFLLFGEHTWSLRLPAALFGVAGLGALYALGRRVAGSVEAAFATAVLAVSYHHIWFSQNARGYTALFFWTVLASLLLLRAFDDPHPRRWILYAAAAALGVYTHLTMMFVIAGHFLIYGWWLRRNRAGGREGFFLGFLLAGLLTFQLHALVIPQMRAAIAQTISWVDAWKDPLWTLAEMARGIRVGPAVLAAGAACGLVFIVGLVSYARTCRAVIAFLILPAAIGAGYVVAVGHHLWPRFFFFVAGFAVLIAVRGCRESSGGLLRAMGASADWQRRGASAACAAMVAVSGLSMRNVYGPKQDYGGAMQFVESQRQEGDEVITVGLASWAYRNYFHVPWGAVESVAELEAVRSRARRTWVVYTLEPVLDSMHPELARAIRRDFTRVRTFRGTLANGEILVWRAEKGGMRARAGGIDRLR